MSISFSALSGVKYILYIPVCGDGWVCYYCNNNLRFTENLIKEGEMLFLILLYYYYYYYYYYYFTKNERLFNDILA